jgi:transglutaminase-like putative cysteine protease
MGKASSFVALCRAAGIPARVGFQQLHCPDKPFMSEEVRRLWGDRPLPRHSLGEAYLDGRWLKLDATIDAATAAAWYETLAREVMRALDAADAHDRVASDDALWSGPRPGGA